MKRLLILVVLLISLTSTCFAAVTYSPDGRVSADIPPTWYYRVSSNDIPDYLTYNFQSPEENTYVSLEQISLGVPYESALTMTYAQKKAELDSAVRLTMASFRKMGARANLIKSDVFDEGFAAVFTYELKSKIYSYMYMTTYKDKKEYTLILSFSREYGPEAGKVYASVRIDGVDFANLNRR